MSPRIVDLRSDTFTVPDQAMRAAMATAEVGDDVWGEDPTVCALEERSARLLGKAAAVMTPSGTMANLIAILAQTHHGDEVIVDREAHIVVYEVAGASAVGGVQLRTVDAAGGAPTAAQVEAAVRSENIHHPVSALLALENTHNRRGGAAVTRAAMDAAAAVAHHHGMRVHCDGARLLNAAVALEEDAATLIAGCDTASLCFSKGLGAPVGSVLVGDDAVIASARRWRKRLGGGMRQAGVLAAGALHALDHGVRRLADDHARAARIAAALDGVAGTELVLPAVPTNIVMVRTVASAVSVVEAAAQEGVLLTVMDTHLVRCMTWNGIDDEAVDAVLPVLRRALGQPATTVTA